MGLDGIKLDVKVPGEGLTKVVQIIIQKGEVTTYFLRYGKRITSEVVERFLEEQGITPEMVIPPGDKELLIPSRRNGKYHIAGAGACLRYGNNFDFFGYSSEYPGGINPEHLEACEAEFPDGARITVAIADKDPFFKERT